MAERKIGGREFKVDRPLATVALALQARLMRAAGGAAQHLPSLIGKMAANKTDEEKQALGGEVIVLLTDIFSRLDPHEYVSLVGDVISLAKIKRPSGQYDPCDLDGDFADAFGDIIPVVVFVLKETFGDFFSGAPAIGSRGK